MHREYSAVSILKFNLEQGTMSTVTSNAGSGDRPIFIAITSKKCMTCRKSKTKHSFTFSGRDLFCNKCDHEAKRREKIGEEEPVKELAQTQQGKHQRKRILRTQSLPLVRPKPKSRSAVNAEALVPEAWACFQERIYCVLFALR